MSYDDDLDPELVTLAYARDWLRERVDDGHKCPCCSQFAKVYKRRINSRQARALIAMYQAGGTDWCHLPDVEAPLHLGGSETGKARYWGLVEEASDEREDGGRSGMWRLTQGGVGYVQGYVLVQKYAHIYDGRCLGLSGEPVSIHDALGVRFDYDELMSA